MAVTDVSSGLTYRTLHVSASAGVYAEGGGRG